MNKRTGRPLMIATFSRKIAAARAMSTLDLGLILVCWVMLGVASLLLAVFPSRWVLRTLGSSIGPVSYAPALENGRRGMVERIAIAVAVAARHAPFRADCYPQALTAAKLCRLFGIAHSVQLGARFATAGTDRPGKLEGHVWVRAGALTICGGAASPRQFGTVACFVHDPRSVAGEAADRACAPKRR